MRRIQGLLLIVRALTPIIIVLLIAGLAMTFVRDLSANLAEPIQMISDEVEVVETALTDAQEDFLAVQTTVGKLVEDLENFTIPNPLATLSTDLTIPSISIPDLPPIPIPDVHVNWRTQSIRYPSGLSFSFTSGLDITWSTFSITFPRNISVTPENFNLSIPDIPSFNVNIPGLELLRTAVGNIIDEVTSIFEVFDPALTAINDLTKTLQVLPDSVDTIIGATQTATGTVGRIVVHWSNLILVVTGIILLLVLNYIFSGMLQDLQDGWAMLRGMS
jgi:hypothetical protein